MGKHDIGSVHKRKNLSSELGYDREDILRMPTEYKRNNNRRLCRTCDVSEKEFAKMRNKILEKY